MRPLAEAATALPPVAFRQGPGVLATAVLRYAPQLLASGRSLGQLTGPFSKVCASGLGLQGVLGVGVGRVPALQLHGGLMPPGLALQHLSLLAVPSSALAPHNLPSPALRCRRCWMARASRTPSSAAGSTCCRSCCQAWLLMAPLQVGIGAWWRDGKRL